VIVTVAAMNKRNPCSIAALAISALALVGCTVGAAASTRPSTTVRPPACKPPSGAPAPIKPTTVSTLEQAYHCILDGYYSGPVLDGRALLVPAFAGLTRELQRRGLDQPNAALPPLSGKRDADWAAFSRAYRQIIAGMPQDPAARQAVAAATMQAMVHSLNDNHAKWQYGRPSVPIGIQLSAGLGPDAVDSAATAPLFATAVVPGGAAAKAGIRPGDEIISVDGAPPFINGVPTQAVFDEIFTGTRPKLRFSLRRPSTGATFTATVTRADSQPRPAGVESRLLPGDIGYVTMPAFAPRTADQVLAAIGELRKKKPLRGVVLDLRGNGGGSPDEVGRLLGAWAHGKTWSYWCDVREHCTPNRTDDTVALLNLRLVALTDRNCASACDAFASAVRTLRLGTLVGTRTAGVVSGAGQPFLLDDGSVLSMPETHQLEADKATIDTIGVPPDHQAPMTSTDLSAGRDPAIAKAQALLS
jgi:carboxyl-terminal processing protease